MERAPLERVDERIHRQEGAEGTVAERSRQGELPEKPLISDARSCRQHALLLDGVAHAMAECRGNGLSLVLRVTRGGDGDIAADVGAAVADVRNDQFLLVSAWKEGRGPT